MYPIRAEIVGGKLTREGRGTFAPRCESRRILRLGVPTHLDPCAIRVVIHDLSSFGLMLETPVRLRVGERIWLDLPEAGAAGAEVVSTMEGRCSCRFEVPLSEGQVDGALLRTRADASEQERLRAPALAAEFALLLMVFVVSAFLFTLASLPVSNFQW